jgi:PilZ domain-containing protein
MQNCTARPVVGSAPNGILHREMGMECCMAERRKSVRSRTYLGGVIAFNKRRSTMNCYVRNISAAGARVALTNAAVIPDQFELAIAQKERSYRARMVWRGANEAGVAFLSEYTQDVSVPLDWVRRLRDSETEKAVLRRRISQLTENGAI